MKKVKSELNAELLILPDGRILVQNLTQPIAEILQILNPHDRQIAPRVGRKSNPKSARRLSPHPDPLPKEEGTAVAHFGKTRRPSSSLQPSLRQSAGNDSPSLWGEGRGEHFPNLVSRLEPMNRKVTPISRSASFPSLLARADQEIGATVHGEGERSGQISNAAVRK